MLRNLEETDVRNGYGILISANKHASLYSVMNSGIAVDYYGCLSGICHSLMYQKPEQYLQEYNALTSTTI